MEGKFLGLGLTNIIGLFIMFIVMIIVAKVALTKYQVPGASEMIAAV